jgi:hypothetical protein
MFAISWLLIRQLVPFYIRHSLFDVLRFEQQRETPFD